MNYQSQPLQKHELQAMKADPQILARLIKSYQLMLDFYGMKLVDKDTGLLSCSLPPRDFEPRYRNFMSASSPLHRSLLKLKTIIQAGHTTIYESPAS